MVNEIIYSCILPRYYIHKICFIAIFEWALGALSVYILCAKSLMHQNWRQVKVELFAYKSI